MVISIYKGETWGHGGNWFPQGFQYQLYEELAQEKRAQGSCSSLRSFFFNLHNLLTQSQKATGVFSDFFYISFWFEGDSAHPPYLFEVFIQLGVVAHTSNPSTRQPKGGCEFEANLGNSMSSRQTWTT